MNFESNSGNNMPLRMPTPETPPGGFDGSKLEMRLPSVEDAENVEQFDLGNMPAGKEVKPVSVEGVEFLDELDLKSLNPGDRAFITTASGSRYLFENLDSGKLVMYNKPKDAPENAVWGVPQIVYEQASFVAKKGERLIFALIANGGITPQKATAVDSIEIHRHGSAQG